MTAIATWTMGVFFTGGGNAHADTGPTGDPAIDGGGVTAPADVTPDTPQAQAKEALANAWATSALNGGSSVPYDRLAGAYAAKYGATALTGATGRQNQRAVIPAVSSSLTLAMTQSAQQKAYYCGPAEGYAMLKYLNNTHAANNGASLSQAAVASPSHMATDVNGGTPFASKNFVNGLNVWRGSFFYVQETAPSAAEFKEAILYDLDDHAMPLAADTVEIAKTGPHYNHHPQDRTIGHWLAVYGYSSSGATANFIDSSTSSFHSARPTFTASTSSFASTYLQSNGIAW